MGQQYDRALNLTVGGETVAQLAGDPDNSLRVRFKIVTRTTQAPNHIQVIVSNLSAQHAQSLVEKCKGRVMVELDAGYVGSSGPIFKGDTYYCINGRESPTETTLQIFARDGGNAYDYGVISKSLASGSTPMDHYKALLQALQPHGITQGYVPTDLLSKPKYPRGVSFAGMVKEHMRTLAASYGCSWSIQNNQLQMVPTDGAVPGAPYVMSSSSGMVGMPTQTPTGIMVRCLINPAINLGSGNTIQIDQKDIQQAALSPNYTADGANAQLPEIATDGLYRILHIEATGDTRGNEWYMDLTCFTKNGSQIGIPDGIKINMSN